MPFKIIIILVRRRKILECNPGNLLFLERQRRLGAILGLDSQNIPVQKHDDKDHPEQVAAGCFDAFFLAIR